jgi:hypothetical protein
MIVIPLRSVANWVREMTCTPTALCAATGRSRADVQQAIREASRNAAWQDTDRWGANPQHWRDALTRLGFKCEVATVDRPLSINEVMGRNANNRDLILIVSYPPGPSSNDEAQGHVFAAQGNRYVDYDTMGDIKPFKAVDKDLKDHLVKYVVRVGLDPT